MEKVFLRVYNREIESMIEGGQLDEAVAHCQHIIKTYPMHLETYRLLGKAFLEARRYADAADIFERILMAVPDDFVSHVGMSIIRDDQGKLDDAIWHMERAFEVQPSNSAIQGELRRLFGRRDGVEPSKIRLSRDALANMYSQGELFNQAIAEIRSVLADDPNRPDLQVMLTRAYYRSGQKVEAAENAAALLKKYPYCMDALRVLVDVLPGTGRADNTQVYRHRLQLLDPYSSFAIESVFSSDRVADSAVSLERMDYRPGAMPGSAHPDWASSLGIKLTDDKKTGQAPAWMQPATIPEQPPAFSPAAPEPDQAPVNNAAPDAIPDWMRSAGWLDSAGDAQEVPAASGEQHVGEPIAKADIPDWLMSMAPADVAATGGKEPEDAGESLPLNEDGIPDWLKPMAPAETTSQPQAVIPETNIPLSATGDDIPDFLKPLSAADASAPTPVEPMEVPESDLVMDQNAWDVDDQVDFPTPAKDLQPEAEPTGLSQPSEDENMPDWLKGLAPVSMAEEIPATPQGPVEQAPSSLESSSADDDNIPDWLKGLTPTAEAPGMVAAPQEPVEPPQKLFESQPAEAQDMPDWLASMRPAEDTGTLQPEHDLAIPDQTPDQEGDVPDWLSSLTPAEAAPEKPAEPQLSVEPLPDSMHSDLPDWLSSLTDPETPAEQPQEPEQHVQPQPEAMEGNVPDWLSSLAATETPVEQPQKPEQPVQPQPEALESNVPDWLSSLAPAETPVEQPKEPEQPVQPQPEAVENNVPDWLSSLSPTETPVEQPREPEQPLQAQPEPVESSLPDWLSSLGTPKTPPEQPRQTEPSSEPQNADEENIPAWLKLIRQKQQKTDLPPVPDRIPEQEVPVGFEPIPPVEAAMESPSAVEPVAAENPDYDLPPLKPATEGAEAFPDFLTGMGARASAAAAAAAEVLNQPTTSESATHQAAVPPESVEQTPAKTPEPEVMSGSDIFRPTGEVKPLNIEDDAMGWLESLAAKQGARPEELLTNPQDRSVEMPDWLRHPDEARGEPPAALAPEQIRSLPETLPLEPLGRFAQAARPTPDQPAAEPPLSMEQQQPAEEKTETPVPPATPVVNDADTLAWLEQLTGADENKPGTAPLAVEPAQEQRVEWPPAEDFEPLVQGEQPVPPEEIPASALSEPAPDESDITITSWLNKKDVEEAIGKNLPETPADLQPAAPADELPDWLKDLEKPVTPLETPKPDEDLPDWLRQPLPMDEPQAGPEPAAPGWVDESIPVDKQAVPTVPEEWLPAESKLEELNEPYTGPESLLAGETAPEMESGLPPASEAQPPSEPQLQAEPVYFSSRPPVIPPTLKQTGMLSLIPTQDKDAELLSNAQTVLDQNSLNESMKLYSKLVKKGRLLDEVIHDLREAIYRYPVDVIIWQTLGDAYMRANRLQDALDAYTKAEELLR